MKMEPISPIAVIWWKYYYGKKIQKKRIPSCLRLIPHASHTIGKWKISVRLFLQFPVSWSVVKRWTLPFKYNSHRYSYCSFNFLITQLRCYTKQENKLCFPRIGCDNLWTLSCDKYLKISTAVFERKITKDGRKMTEGSFVCFVLHMVNSGVPCITRCIHSIISDTNGAYTSSQVHGRQLCEIPEPRRRYSSKGGSTNMASNLHSSSRRSNVSRLHCKYLM